MSNPAPTNPKTRGCLAPIFIVGGLLTLSGLGIGFLVLMAAGNVVGVEFSPDDFSKRRFQFVRLPGLNWVVRGISYRDETSDFERSLGQKGLITTTSPKNWHLCFEGIPELTDATQPAECDARFLVDYLNLPHGESSFKFYWEFWNDSHPELAKIYWPMIAQLARDEMYLAVPEIMEWAIRVSSLDPVPEETHFEQELKERLAKAYQTYATIDQSMGRSERAKVRFDRANQMGLGAFKNHKK